MHPHEDDVFNTVLREQVVGFLPVVGDGVALIVDLDEVDLARPRLADGEFLLAIAAHVGVVDRQLGLAKLVRPTPVGSPADVLGKRLGWLGAGSILRTLASRCALVKIDRRTGSVNDEHTLLASLLDDGVHRLGHLDHALGCVGAPVVVPHVDHNDSSFAGLPDDLGLDRLILAAASRGERLRTCLERDWCGVGHGGRKTDACGQSQASDLHGASLAKCCRFVKRLGYGLACLRLAR